jgi:surface protein
VWARTYLHCAYEHSALLSTFAFVGSQTFRDTTAFNADISKWNTASVTYMAVVCAAFDPAHESRRTRSVGIAKFIDGDIYIYE